jgi:hypothetical protein
VLVTLAAPVSALAADTTIGFDDLPPNTTVTNQYQGQGVYFQASEGLLPAVRTVPGGQAHSGTQVVDIDNCFGCEFFTPRTVGRFTDFRQTVSLRAGYFSEGSGTVQVTLRALNSGGTPIATTTATLTAGNGFHTLMSVSSPTMANDIAAFELSGPANSSAPIGFDDLTYDIPAVPPPPDFSLSVDQQQLVLLRGNSLDIPVGISRYNGSNGDISFAASNLPAGVSAAFLTNPVTGTGASTVMRLTAAPDAPTTDFNGVEITITGTPVAAAGSTPRTATKNIRVAAPFQILLAGGAADVDVASCAQVDIPVRMQRELSFSGTVDLSVSGVPAGVQATFVPPSLGPPSDGSAFTHGVLRVQAALGAPMTDRTITVTGTHSGGATAADTVDLDRVVQTVEATTGLGLTARRMSPGTEITLRGGGFCGGSKVQFGHEAASTGERAQLGEKLLATPTSISADGREMKARVPRLGVTGRVTVIQTDGSTFSTPAETPFTVHSFRSRNGFAFDNYPVEWISWGEFTDLFGAEEMFVHVNPCWFWGGSCPVMTGIPDPLAYLYWGIANVALRESGGHCFGISLTVQELAAGQLNLNRFTPGGATGAFELNAPGAPASSLHHQLEMAHTAQTSAEFLRHFLTPRSFGQEVAKIKSELANGRYPGIALDGPGLKGHVITAYDYEELPGGGKRVYVYDNNHPYVPRNTGPDLSSGQSGSDRNELASVAQHDWQELNLGVLEILPNNGGWTFAGAPGWGGQGWSFTTIPLGVIPDNPTIPINVNGLTSLAIVFGSDGGGAESGGVSGPGAEDAAGFGPLDSEAQEASAFYAASSGKPITHLVKGTGAGTYDQAVVANDLVGRVDGVRSAKGGRDRLTLDPREDELRFAGNRTKPLDAHLGTRARDGSTRAAHVRTTTGRGGSDALAFAGGGNRLSYTHDGPATTLRLDLVRTGRDGLATSFRGPKVRVRPGDRLTFRPRSWRSLDRVRMTTRSRGGSTTSRTLRDRRRSAPRVRIVRLGATADRRPRAALRLRARRLAPGSAATVSFRVTRAGRTVARRGVAIRRLRRGTRTVRWRVPRLAKGRHRLTAYVMVTSGGRLPETALLRRSRALRVR